MHEQITHTPIFHRFVGREERCFLDVYTFSPVHVPYFHVIKLFSGTNYNYALLKIIKNSHQAPQLWKNLLPACFSNLHHWFWWCLKSTDAPITTLSLSLSLSLSLLLSLSLIGMGYISVWGGVVEGAGRMAFSSIDRCASVWFYLHVFISFRSRGNMLLGNFYLFICFSIYWLFVEARSPGPTPPPPHTHTHTKSYEFLNTKIRDQTLICHFA